VEQRPAQIVSPPGGVRASDSPRRTAKVIGVCSWLYLLLILALWALLRLADLWWPATLLMFSPRWLLVVPGAILALAALFLRRRSLIVLSIALVLALGPVTSFCIPWPFLSSEAASAERLRLMTCNMHYYKGSAGRLDALLDEARPDIVALQEWPGWNKSELLAGRQWHVHESSVLFLASRFPIRQVTELGHDSMDDVGAVLHAELETPGGIVTLFSVHLASPREGLYNVVHDREEGADDLEAGSALRWVQSEQLARRVEEVSGPVLLAGDFNTPVESAIFRRYWDRYTDAFRFAGWGWGYTFIGGKTAVRIDHILAGPGWLCERCRVGPNVGSPHRPVIADLIRYADR
jgi:endonuclease/exonuclease/phosphatase (EEP) superfamily protein YafD